MIYKINDLSFCYPNGNMVLRDVNIDFCEGDILSVLGPNGSGKSTLLHCLAGLLRPRSGEILLGGIPLERMPASKIARKVGYIRQTQQISFSWTVLHYVTMGIAARIPLFGKPSQKDEEAARFILREMGIAHLESKPCTELSGGELQQAAIARTLMQGSKVLLLDEPLSHLDFGNQLRVLNMIKRMRENGYSIIVTTHNPDHALLLGGSAAILQRDRRLTCGTCEEILTEQNLRELYQADLRLMHIPQLSRHACLAAGFTERVYP